ncbi:MAG: methionyl-tRNA formyltransferase [Syntrophomonadaceae bacterium]|nr:methionyl-tRNA formyltransferase [Syntrophomonadaceae bacterium]
MRLVFMGTSQFAVPSLRKLILSGYDIPLVVTQPDRPAQRGRKLTPPPVKLLAEEFELPLIQPESIRTPEFAQAIKRTEPQVIVVVSYGKILPGNILKIPPLGCINVHGSLLPAYRGAAPIQRALMAGEKTVGVTTMYMDETMDTGDIILQRAIDLTGDEDYGETMLRLSDIGADLLLETLEQVEWGVNPRIPQDHSRATYAPPLTAEDELIKWEMKSQHIRDQIRGLSPEPGAYTWLNGEKLKIFKAQTVETEAAGQPGEVVRLIPNKGFVVKAGEGALLVLEVQRAGKRRISAADFLRGSRLREGDRLGGC